MLNISFHHTMGLTTLVFTILAFIEMMDFYYHWYSQRISLVHMCIRNSLAFINQRISLTINIHKSLFLYNRNEDWYQSSPLLSHLAFNFFSRFLYLDIVINHLEGLHFGNSKYFYFRSRITEVIILGSM